MMQALVKRISVDQKVIHKYLQKTFAISEKRLSMQRWNVAGALHNPNGILRYANVPKGQVKVVISWC